MKKQLFLVAALALVFAACEKKEEPQLTVQVADFENLEIASESVMHLTETGFITSGDFQLQQDVSTSEWGTYYFGNVPTNLTSNEYKGDYQNDMSTAGGAHSGNNFVVWTGSYTGLDIVRLNTAAEVPGMYVCNTPWVVDAILNGDGMSDDEGAPFGENDYFLLTVTGSLNGSAVNSKVEFYLAQGKDYVKDWTFVDLSTLGTVDQLQFALTSSKKNTLGMTTPAYFALDDLGAKAPAK